MYVCMYVCELCVCKFHRTYAGHARHVYACMCVCMYTSYTYEKFTELMHIMHMCLYVCTYICMYVCMYTSYTYGNFTELMHVIHASIVNSQIHHPPKTTTNSRPKIRVHTYPISLQRRPGPLVQAIQSSQSRVIFQQRAKPLRLAVPTKIHCDAQKI